MKKITLLFLFVLGTSLGFAQNVFTDGAFDNPSAWTIIQHNGNNNGMVTIANGVAVFDDVAQGSWGSEGHVGINKTFTVPNTGWYQFDLDIVLNGVDEFWAELWVGTEAPTAEQDYNDGNGATKVLGHSAWDCAANNTYTGSLLASGCQGLNGEINLDVGTTYYFVFRAGGINWGTNGVTIDNITLVSTTAPPPPITEMSLDFQTATTFEGADGATYTDLTTNSVTDGINPSSLAGQISDCNTGQWNHIYIDEPDGIDFTSGDRGFSIKVLGQRAAPVLLKFQEGGSHWINHEIPGNYTTPGSWEEIIWDLSAFDTTNMTRIVLFFDIDNPNPAANPADDTFQIDDLVFGAYGTMSTKDFEIEGLKIYPNPANDAWTISTTNQIIETVEIFNILGNRVLSINPNALSARLNASNLTAGIYFANITTELGSTSRKLIKQ